MATLLPKNTIWGTPWMEKTEASKFLMTPSAVALHIGNINTVLGETANHNQQVLIFSPAWWKGINEIHEGHLKRTGAWFRSFHLSQSCMVRNGIRMLTRELWSAFSCHSGPTLDFFSVRPGYSGLYKHMSNLKQRKSRECRFCHEAGEAPLYIQICTSHMFN